MLEYITNNFVSKASRLHNDMISKDMFISLQLGSMIVEEPEAVSNLTLSCPKRNTTGPWHNEIAGAVVFLKKTVKML